MKFSCMQVIYFISYSKYIFYITYEGDIFQTTIENTFYTALKISTKFLSEHAMASQDKGSYKKKMFKYKQ